VTFDLSIVRNMENYGAAELKIENMDVDTSGMDVDITGETDITKVLGKGMDFFKNYVSLEAVELFERYYTDNVEDKINEYLNIYNNILPMDGGLGLNTTLAQDILIGKDFLSVPIDGGSLDLYAPE
jgi:hypothetical protein